MIYLIGYLAGAFLTLLGMCSMGGIEGIRWRGWVVIAGWPLAWLTLLLAAVSRVLGL